MMEISRVTIICTRHEENGNCNSTQLLNIIDGIKPDVTFEELSQAGRSIPNKLKLGVVSDYVAPATDLLIGEKTRQSGD